MDTKQDLLAGLLTRDQLMQQLGIKSKTTVCNWIARGMAGVVRINHQRTLFDVAKVRAWIDQHEVDKTPRRRGRPRRRP